jgi:hypothetical protein
VKALIAFFLLFAGTPAWAFTKDDHDIHVSLCELRWNEESSAFEVSIKIFIDDLELALSKEGAQGLFIGSAKETANANEHIAAYLKKHFRIELDGVLLEPEFLGKEVSEDFLAVWCYVEFSGKVSKAKKCVLSNDILLEMYDDQRNIMDIRMTRNHKEYTIFQPGRSTWSYTF